MTKLSLRFRDFFLALAVPPAFLFFVFAAHSIPGGLPSWLGISLGDAATAAGSFATGAAIFVGLWQFARQSAASRSQFALEMAIRGVERAFLVIEGDSPTRRIAWVNAARLLLRAQDTTKGITETDHKASWELFHEEWRIRFFKYLRATPEYYLGLGEYVECGDQLNFDRAAIESAMRKASRTTELSVEGLGSTGFGDTILNERVLKIVYDFASFPAHHRDLLQEQATQFSDADLDDMIARDTNGLLAFIRATRRYHVVNGQVHKRGSGA